MHKTHKIALPGILAVVWLVACSASDEPTMESTMAIKKCHEHKDKKNKKHDCDEDAGSDDAGEDADGFDGNISDDGSRPDATPDDAPSDAPPLNNSCKDDDGKDLFTGASVHLYGGDTTCTTETVTHDDICLTGDQLEEWVCEDQAENPAPANQCTANNTASPRFFSCQKVCVSIGATKGDCVTTNGLGRCVCSI